MIRVSFWGLSHRSLESRELWYYSYLTKEIDVNRSVCLASSTFEGLDFAQTIVLSEVVLRMLHVYF